MYEVKCIHKNFIVYVVELIYNMWCYSNDSMKTTRESLKDYIRYLHPTIFYFWWIFTILHENLTKNWKNMFWKYISWKKIVWKYIFLCQIMYFQQTIVFMWVKTWLGYTIWNTKNHS